MRLFMQVLYTLLGLGYLVWATLILCNVVSPPSLKDVSVFALTAFAMACFAYSKHYE